MPTAQPEAELVADPAAQTVGDPLGWPEEPHRAGHVHEGLVEADRLDHRRDVVEDLVQLRR